MKTKLLLSTLSLVCLMSFGQTPMGAVPNKDYVTALGGADGSATESFPSVLDLTNNFVYIAGYSFNTSSQRNYVLIKYDNNTGAIQWQQTYDFANGMDRARAVTVDNSSNVYVTGESQNASGNYDIATLKYDQNGNLLWSVRYNGLLNLDDKGSSITVDPSGNIYICGFSSGLTGKDFIVIKYNSAGVQQFVYTKNGTANVDDVANSIAFFGNKLYVTGNLTNLITNQDIYVTSLNANNGFVNWSKTENGTSNLNDQSLKVKIQGNDVLICGGITNTSTNQDYFFAKYNASNGNTSFKKTYDAFGTNDFATDLTIDASNTYAIVGVAQNGVNYEYHTTKYTNAGVFSWVNKHAINTNTISILPKIGVDPVANHFYVSGLKKNVTIDGGLYQITPGGNETWSDYHDGASGLNDAHVDLSVDNIGRIYLASVNETAPNALNIALIRYSQTPVYFPPDINNEPIDSNFVYIENKGQLLNTLNTKATEVKFYTLNTYPAYFFTPTRYSMAFGGADSISNNSDSLQRIDVSFTGSNPLSRIYSFDTQPALYNFFLPHCTNQALGIKGKNKLFVPNLYSGIDWHCASNTGGLKQYFVVKPTAEPSSIILNFDNATNLSIDANQNLIITSFRGSSQILRPVAYQVNLFGNPIALSGSSNFVSLGGGKYSISVPSYNNSLPLIIELRSDLPFSKVLHGTTPEWYTPHGGINTEVGLSVGVDVNYNPYFTGYTNSLVYPANASLVNTYSANKDAFITKFGNAIGSNATFVTNGDRALWFSFFGGNNGDELGSSVTAIGSGTAGSVYVTGVTTSADLPTGSVGAAYTQTILQGGQDAFILKLDNVSGGSGGGGLGIDPSIWATFFGGNGIDGANSIKVDLAGNIFIGGYTGSVLYSGTNCGVPTDNNFPMCNAFSAFNNGGAFGGGNTDAFIARFDNMNNLTWSSFFGGVGDDEIKAITLFQNKLYLTGLTSSSSGFPLQNFGGVNAYNQSIYGGGSFDAFVGDFTATGILEWSSLFGGSGNDQALTIAVNSTENVYIAGITNSSISCVTTGTCNCKVPNTGDFPLCNTAGSHFQGTTNANATSFDGFFAKFSSAKVFNWGTYYGEGKNEKITGISINANDKVFYIGYSSFTVSTSSTKLTQFGGNAQWDQSFSNSVSEGILGRFGASNAREYASFLGNLGVEQYNSIYAINGSTTQPYFYIAGQTSNAFSYSGCPTLCIDLHQSVFCPNVYLQYPNTLGGTTNDAVFGRFNTNSPPMIGIKEIKSDIVNGIIVYPNPNNGAFDIKTDKDLNNVSLKVFDVTGKLVFEQESKTLLSTESLNIFTKNLKAGMYFIVLNSTEQKTNIKFIIE